MPNHAPEHDVTAMTKRLRRSARTLKSLPGAQKNACLEALATALLEDVPAITKAARDDAAHARAEDEPDAVVNSIQISRGDLEEKARLAGTLGGLPNPVGRVESTWMRPNGLKIEKVRVPLGVIAVLVEYQPLTIVDAILLCLKAGNALLLHAGPMVYRTCQQITSALNRADVPDALPERFFYFMPGHGVDVRRALVTQRQIVDLAIPVGRESWISAATADATVPILCERRGSCHVFIDHDADTEMAMAIVSDAVNPAGEACRADVILLHRDLLRTVAPMLIALFREDGIMFSVDEDALQAVAPALGRQPHSIPTRGGEVRVVVVDDLEEAAAWIAERGAGHSDAIVTENRQAALKFQSLVDSAGVYVNASVRFTGGAQFGMGGQIAVSTGRIHARGPIAIDELTTYKYLVTGKGQTLS